MNIEEFMNEENHMCNLGEDLFARSSNPELFMICRIAILIKKSFTGSVSILSEI